MRQVAIVFGLLCLCAAGLGLWLGLDRARLTETEMINRMADRYATQTGGDRADCHAVPGVAPVWLTVICEGPAGRRAYPVDTYGRLVDVKSGGGA